MSIPNINDNNTQKRNAICTTMGIDKNLCAINALTSTFNAEKIRRIGICPKTDKTINIPASCIVYIIPIYKIRRNRKIEILTTPETRYGYF